MSVLISFLNFPYSFCHSFFNLNWTLGSFHSSWIITVFKAIRFEYSLAYKLCKRCYFQYFVKGVIFNIKNVFIFFKVKWAKEVNCVVMGSN